MRQIRLLRRFHPLAVVFAIAGLTGAVLRPLLSAEEQTAALPAVLHR